MTRRYIGQLRLGDISCENLFDRGNPRNPSDWTISIHSARLTPGSTEGRFCPQNWHEMINNCSGCSESDGMPGAPGVSVNFVGKPGGRLLVATGERSEPVDK